MFILSGNSSNILKVLYISINLKKALEIGFFFAIEKFNLGIVYFKNGNFDDFSLKLQELILDADLRKKLTELSLKNIVNLSWDKRMETVLTSARSSTG